MKYLALISLVIIACSAAGCASKQQLHRFEYREVVMGGQARIVFYAPDEEQALHAARAAFTRLHELDACMSDYQHDSELMRLCRTHDKPVGVSHDLLDVLTMSRSVHRKTDGAFDVTIGPVVALWRAARKSNRMPSELDLQSARARVGMHRVVIDETSKTITLRAPDMRLDLGGIGKGFAAQKACERLTELGYNKCLVDLGGDIVAGDAPPDELGWTVVIDADALGNNDGTLTLCNNAVATSGDAYQHVVLGGVRYSHIVDPRTGLGVSVPRATVVIAPDGGLADAVASAASVSGFDIASVWPEAHWPEIQILVREPKTPSGTPQWRRTKVRH